MYKQSFDTNSEGKKEFIISIDEIKSNPREFIAQEVTISGVVTSSINFFGLIKWYRLTDSTGSIIIRPIVDEVPPEGTKKIVHGKVFQKSYLSGLESVGIKETSFPFAIE